MDSKKNIAIATAWGGMQIVIYLFVYFSGFCYVSKNAQTINDDQKRLCSSDSSDAHVTQIENSQIIHYRSDATMPDTVECGMYLNRILKIDIVNSTWDYEFYLWFRWHPWQINFIGGFSASDPKDAPFKILNGDIKSIRLQNYLTNNYDSAYALYYVSASNNEFFQTQLFPLDKHILTIDIEHSRFDIARLYLKQDTNGIKVSSRVFINGYSIGASSIISKPHTYSSSLGEPNKSDKRTVSRCRFFVPIERGHALVIFLKLFTSLFIAVLIAFLSFFADEKNKVTIIIGSFYAAVASFYLLSTKIPVSSYMSLGEIINSVSLITIFFILVNETILKTYINTNNKIINNKDKNLNENKEPLGENKELSDESKKLLKLTQRITFAITLSMYVLFNILFVFMFSL